MECKRTYSKWSGADDGECNWTLNDSNVTRNGEQNKFKLHKLRNRRSVSRRRKRRRKEETKKRVNKITASKGENETNRNGDEYDDETRKTSDQKIRFTKEDEGPVKDQTSCMCVCEQSEKKWMIVRNGGSRMYECLCDLREDTIEGDDGKMKERRTMLH